MIIQLIVFFCWTDNKNSDLITTEFTVDDCRHYKISNCWRDALRHDKTELILYEYAKHTYVRQPVGLKSQILLIVWKLIIEIFLKPTAAFGKCFAIVANAEKTGHCLSKADKSRVPPPPPPQLQQSCPPDVEYFLELTNWKQLRRKNLQINLIERQFWTCFKIFETIALLFFTNKRWSRQLLRPNPFRQLLHHHEAGNRILWHLVMLSF